MPGLNKQRFGGFGAVVAKGGDEREPALPVGMDASMFELPSKGSNTTTYLASSLPSTSTGSSSWNVNVWAAPRTAVRIERKGYRNRRVAFRAWEAYRRNQELQGTKQQHSFTALLEVSWCCGRFPVSLVCPWLHASTNGVRPDAEATPPLVGKRLKRLHEDLKMTPPLEMRVFVLLSLRDATVYA